mmetsp:Transcript_6355/g.22649  ORF Transcript_6355/g.22649 Transcript_6355/m.22649 type:complete len:208 (-) Transcript_6355:1403-2026(-)
MLSDRLSQPLQVVLDQLVVWKELTRCVKILQGLQGERQLEAPPSSRSSQVHQVEHSQARVCCSAAQKTSSSLLQLLRPILGIFPLLLHLLEEVESLAGVCYDVCKEEEAEGAQAAVAICLSVPGVQLQAASVGVESCPVVPRPIEMISSHLQPLCLILIGTPGVGVGPLLLAVVFLFADFDLFVCLDSFSCGQVTTTFGEVQLDPSS